LRSTGVVRKMHAGGGDESRALLRPGFGGITSAVMCARSRAAAVFQPASCGVSCEWPRRTFDLCARGCEEKVRVDRAESRSITRCFASGNAGHGVGEPWLAHLIRLCSKSTAANRGNFAARRRGTKSASIVVAMMPRITMPSRLMGGSAGEAGSGGGGAACEREAGRAGGSGRRRRTPAAASPAPPTTLPAARSGRQGANAWCELARACESRHE
jgi:hypothetical protein